MEALIPGETEESKKWAERFREAARFGFNILKESVPRLQKEDDMIIYPFFRLKEDVDKKEFGILADMAEPFVMAAIRDGFSKEELDKYFFAYLRNADKCEVVIGVRLQTDKDRADLKKLKEEEEEKVKAEEK